MVSCGDFAARVGYRCEWVAVRGKEPQCRNSASRDCHWPSGWCCAWSVEEPTHCFAIAGLLAEDGSLGRVWRVQKAVVYRAAQRLEHLGLIMASEKQPSAVGRPGAAAGDPRGPRGRRADGCASRPPTPGISDSELLVKVALLDRVAPTPGAAAGPVRAARPGRRRAGRPGTHHHRFQPRRRVVAARIRLRHAAVSRCPPGHGARPAGEPAGLRPDGEGKGIAGGQGPRLRPPSTTMRWPVTKPASSEARKPTA